MTNDTTRPRMMGGVPLPPRPAEPPITCCGHDGEHDWIGPMFGCGYHGCSPVTGTGTMTNDTTTGPVEAFLTSGVQLADSEKLLEGARTIDQQIADLKHAVEHLRRVTGIEDESIRCTAERERDATREVVAWAIRKRDYNHADLHDGPNDDCMEGWCREINPHLKLLREQSTDTAEGG